MFDPADVSYVKRISIGSRDPEHPLTEAQHEAATALLNRCLNETPRGRILGVEKTFSILRHYEHQIVLQVLTYHIGFVRRPYWLEDEERQAQAAPVGHFV